MSRVFRRPMFRKGGNVGEGIMTGIRDNYEVGGSAKERLAKIAEQYPSTGFDPLTQFLIQGGLNLASQPSTGGVLSDIATAAKEPTAQLFKGMAEKGNLARELALAGEQLDIQRDFEKENLEFEGQIKKDVAKLEASDSAKMQTANAVKSLFAPKIKAIEDKIIEAKQSGAGKDVLGPLVIQLQNLQTQSENAYLDVLIPGKSRSEQILDMAAIIKENDLGGSKSNKQIIAEAESIVDMASGIRTKEADGGRIGYAMGTPKKADAPMLNEPMMNAPAVESKARSIDMPFEEFRRKLPANITDDIANIIYYNSSAFADFANIETQDDVYAFNSKYDVNLTLPFNTETT